LATIGFNEMSIAQLVAIGDGLMRAKEFPLAAHAYRVALRSGGASPALWTKYGLATNPRRETPAMFNIATELEAVDGFPFVGVGLATWHKPLPFLEDGRFMNLAGKHQALLNAPNWHWNLNTVLWAVKEAKSVPGDFVELGVFKGHTTMFCADYVDFQTWPKTWWLCDTFEGVPADQLDPGWADINRNMYEGTFSYQEVVERFAAFPNIKVHQGRVPEALAEGCPDQIAFLHMDLNSTTAEIAALEYIFDRLSPGGIIIFDDFGWAASGAQNRAEREWFAARGLQILSLPTGQGLYRKL